MEQRIICKSGNKYVISNPNNCIITWTYKGHGKHLTETSDTLNIYLCFVMQGEAFCLVFIKLTINISNVVGALLQFMQS